jgi:hypothetical protein
MIRFLPKIVLLFLVLAFPACKEETTKKQLYFRDLTIPVGVGNVQVVSDENLNLETGGEIKVSSAVEPEIDKDELDNLIASFMRQVKDRRGFQTGDKAAKIELLFYTSANAAKAKGEDWLGRLSWSGSGEPTIINKQKLPLLKWARKAFGWGKNDFGKQTAFTGALKPQLLADANSMSLELTIPYVADDGSGKYVEKLTYTKAISEFTSYTMVLFDKIPELKKLTFIGKHNDERVVKISLDREGYNKIDLHKAGESLGAFDGKQMELYLGKQLSDKAWETKKRAEFRKVYREALSRLPKEQVEIAKDIK